LIEFSSIEGEHGSVFQKEGFVMKKYGCLARWFSLILIPVGLTACWAPTDTPKKPETPGSPPPVDTAFWFKEIHDELIVRVGDASSDVYQDIVDPGGVGAGQIVNYQYVYDAINAEWGTALIPGPGTAAKPANCEYLLQTIDMANSMANCGTTTFGASTYATTQVVDKTTVDTAIKTLWAPGGKFVALAGGSNNTDEAAYSNDGSNWIAATLPSSAIWKDIAYGNGSFVALGYKAAHSADGINWTTLSNLTGWSCIVYGNDTFIVFSYANKTAAYSTDGINWEAARLPGGSGWISSAYGNGKFVVIADSGSAAYSTDGIVWKPAVLPSRYTWYAVAYGNGRFVAIGKNKTACSTDGIAWVEKYSLSWTNIVYGNGKFVVIGSTGSAAYSTDGIDFILTNGGYSSGFWSDFWTDLAYGNGKFVALGNDRMAYSTDGIAWTPAATPLNANWNSVTYGGE
jgi:hypothetical protein